MQDRFKLRVWDNVVKKYLTDDEVYKITDGILDSVYDLLIDENKHFILGNHDLTFEQCTGLKDKNGKLIYEGDILKATFKNEESETDYLPVYYNKNEFSVGFNVGDAGWFSDYFVGEIEVAGNIHENFELLEEG